MSSSVPRHRGPDLLLRDRKVVAMRNLNALNKLGLTEAEFSADDKPVVIVGKRVHRIAELDRPIEAASAYAIGVNETTMVPLVEHLRVQSLFFYEHRVHDLAPLLQLEGLRHLAISWNTKLEGLEILGKLSGLELLILRDTKKVRDLTPLAKLEALRGFEYSGGMWSKNTAVSLEPLASLPKLEELDLSNLNVESGGLRPLAGCKALKMLSVPNQFPTEDYAYLSVHLPKTRCEMFAPYVGVGGLGDGADVMVVGTRKPFLSKRKDRARLKKYVQNFKRMQREFAEEKASSTDG